MASLILLRNMQTAKQPLNGAVSIVFVRNASQSSTDPDAPRPLRTTNLAAMKRGTGGRSSFNGIVATVFGATGFVGRYVVNKLGKCGTQLIIPYRGDWNEVRRLKVAGDLGQVLFHPYHLEDEKSIHDAVKYSNVVINLVGRDWETKNFSFNKVHVEGARRIAKICKEAGVERLIHMSALNAEPDIEGHVLKNGSGFLKSKYHGEVAVRGEFPNATILRPSDIYGAEDRFLLYYAHMWRRTFRAMPLWHNGERTIKQPVYVADVAQGILNCARDPETAGKVYQAVGPKRYQLCELVDWFHRVMRKDEKWWGYQRYDLRFDPTFYMKVMLTSMVSPGAPIGNLHMERVEREYVTDVVRNGVPTLEDLGVNLTHMEDQVPWELRPYRAALYYEAELGEFETPSPPHALDPREEARIA